MTKKRLLVTLITVFLLMSYMCSINIIAADVHSELHIESKSVSVGETFDVYFIISGYNNINTIGLRIEYDTDMLCEITDVSSNDSADNVLLIKDSFMRHYDIEKGIVTYGDATSLDSRISDQNGKILKLSFVALKKGATQIMCEVQEKTVTKQAHSYYAEGGIIEINDNATNQHEHINVFKEATISTCCTMGNIEHWSCSICNKNFSDQFGRIELKNVVLPFDNTMHSGGEIVRDAITATNFTEGYSGNTYCLGCGLIIKLGQTIPKTSGNNGSDKNEFENNTSKWNNPFTDVDEMDSFYNAIAFVYEKGLFKGVSENQFAPNTTMTRGMFVTVLGRLAGVDTTYFYVVDSEFNDVIPGEWYAPYVEWASQSGIVMGYGDGRFGVHDTITIEQAAVILYRYAAYIGLSQNTDIELIHYNDDEKVSTWASEAVKWVIQNKIYDPTDYYINPQTPAKRSVVAELVYAYVIHQEAVK